MQTRNGDWYALFTQALHDLSCGVPAMVQRLGEDADRGLRAMSDLGSGIAVPNLGQATKTPITPGFHQALHQGTKARQLGLVAHGHPASFISVSNSADSACMRSLASRFTTAARRRISTASATIAFATRNSSTHRLMVARSVAISRWS